VRHTNIPIEPPVAQNQWPASWILGSQRTQHGIKTHSPSQILDRITPLSSRSGTILRRAKLLRELVPLLVPADGNDYLGSHQLRGENPEPLSSGASFPSGLLVLPQSARTLGSSAKASIETRSILKVVRRFLLREERSSLLLAPASSATLLNGPVRGWYETIDSRSGPDFVQ
jgi:hypothetical protein